VEFFSSRSCKFLKEKNIFEKQNWRTYSLVYCWVMLMRKNRLKQQFNVDAALHNWTLKLGAFRGFQGLFLCNFKRWLLGAFSKFVVHRTLSKFLCVNKVMFAYSKTYISEFEAEFKKALTRESGTQRVLFDEKNRGPKILWHCPFKVCNCIRYILNIWAPQQKNPLAIFFSSPPYSQPQIIFQSLFCRSFPIGLKLDILQFW
jgi:hypothetical protein